MGGVWLENIEIWRFSTPQPSDKPGIRWSMIKDVTPFLILWRKKAQLLLDLDNRLLRPLNGKFDVTLTATYLAADLQVPTSTPATHILPLGTLTTREANVYEFPLMYYPNRATLPVNTVRAVVSIGATALAREEFWWSNLPNSVSDVASNKTSRLPDRSGFREIRLSIDDQIAGLAWPQPIVLAGGVSPALHRPIVSDQVFDLAEHEIDITPWLGYLCDKKKHKYTIEVIGENDLIVATFWKISAKIFVWADPNNRITPGPPPTVNVSETEFHSNQSQGAEKEWKYSQSTSRSIEVKSTLNMKGNAIDVVWTQRYSMRGEGVVARYGDYQSSSTFYEGESTLKRDLLTYYHHGFSYPMKMIMDKETLANRKAFRLRAEIDQGTNSTIIGNSVFPCGMEAFVHDLPEAASGCSTYTRKRGHATMYQTRKGKTSVAESDVESMYIFGAKMFGIESGSTFAAGPVLFSHEMRQQNEAMVKNTMYMMKGKVSRLPVATYASDPRYIGWFAPIKNHKHGGTRIFWGRDALSSNVGDISYDKGYGARRTRSSELSNTTETIDAPQLSEQVASDDVTETNTDNNAVNNTGIDFDEFDGDLLTELEEEFEKLDHAKNLPRPSPTRAFFTIYPGARGRNIHHDRPWITRVGGAIAEAVTNGGLGYPAAEATEAPTFHGQEKRVDKDVVTLEED
ncbi:hypothetical protein VHEMI00411 [[Torrubiella] hemipterigena]|uniref:Peptide N-acetyl-beta-D-glucosaminyl asparaginase amidase A N-terminal domain-containing protein n=1 Tax=[Torrubiella] hemipterigena TaxID=1531966 RepID=A0A0A1T4G4_9HYPO|nr:hypothetical protein VHEMI00411 [[Torrubiella] hemipterigena]